MEHDVVSIAAEILVKLKADCAAAGIRWGGNNVALRHTAKRKQLIGEMVMFKMHGSFTLDRWQAHGIDETAIRQLCIEGKLAPHASRFRKLAAAGVRKEA